MPSSGRIGFRRASVWDFAQEELSSSLSKCKARSEMSRVRGLREGVCRGRDAEPEDPVHCHDSHHQ